MREALKCAMLVSKAGNQFFQVGRGGMKLFYSIYLLLHFCLFLMSIDQPGTSNVPCSQRQATSSSR